MACLTRSNIQNQVIDVDAGAASEGQGRVPDVDSGEQGGPGQEQTGGRVWRVAEICANVFSCSLNVLY